MWRYELTTKGAGKDALFKAVEESEGSGGFGLQDAR